MNKSNINDNKQINISQLSQMDEISMLFKIADSIQAKDQEIVNLKEQIKFLDQLNFRVMKKYVIQEKVISDMHCQLKLFDNMY